MATMWFERVGALQLLVHGNASPSPGEWASYMAALRTAIAASQPPKGILVVSDGGGPNNAQRKELVGVFGPLTATTATAVCSSSAFARGITTAITWIARVPMKSFPYSELRQGYEWTKVTTPAYDEVEAKILDAQLRLGFKPSLARVVAA